VQKLVDLMRKHVRLGSACGRIHPIGAGWLGEMGFHHTRLSQCKSLYWRIWHINFCSKLKLQTNCDEYHV
jgi:hypothetical protein